MVLDETDNSLLVQEGGMDLMGLEVGESEFVSMGGPVGVVRERMGERVPLALISSSI